jgi:hypothetical protein
MPTSGGAQYPQFFMQTGVALSESTCKGATILALWECQHGQRVHDFGKDTQYGADLYSTLGYPEFEGSIYRNLCRTPS